MGLRVGPTEYLTSKQAVTGSNPVFRSNLLGMKQPPQRHIRELFFGQVAGEVLIRLFAVLFTLKCTPNGRLLRLKSITQ